MTNGARGSVPGGEAWKLKDITDPQRAARVLDGAIEAFNAFAAADTTVSGLALTRAGLEVQIANLRNEQDKLLTKKERLALTIADAEQDLAGVGANRQRTDLELAKIAAANRLRRSLLATAEEQAGAAVRSREELEQSLRRFEQRNRALADRFHYEIDLAPGAVTDLQLKRDVDLEKARVGAVGRIGDLKLQQEQEVATERTALEPAIRGRRAQLSVLSPRERIGRTQVTTRPVRPRKLRAVILLTLAGGLASLATALGWDYLAAHRDEILRGDRGA